MIPQHTSIYTTALTTIVPECSINLPISYRPLLYITEGYLIIPNRQFNHTTQQYSSLVGSIIDSVIINSQAQPIPYTNFSDTPIRIRQGQVLGFLEPSSACPSPASVVYLSLEEVFQGLPPVPRDEPEHPQAPDGHPYLIQPLADNNIDISQADVSTD